MTGSTGQKVCLEKTEILKNSLLQLFSKNDIILYCHLISIICLCKEINIFNNLFTYYLTTVSSSSSASPPKPSPTSFPFFFRKEEVSHGYQPTLANQVCSMTKYSSLIEAGEEA